MNAVLRIALTYFSIVPLQKWLSIVGVLLVFGALLTHSPVFTVLAFLGAFFIVLVPLILGGTSMRFGSCRSALQLRPGSRWKMLAAAMLTVCVMTAICAFTIWATTRAGMGPPRRSAAGVFVTSQFAIAIWGAFSLFWVFSFVASASRLTFMVVCIGVAAMISRQWGLIGALGGLGSPPLVLACAAIVAWLAFATWYLQTRQVRRPGWGSSATPMGMGGNNTGGWYSSITESRADSRGVAIKAWLLGTTSPISFLIPGVLSVLMILPLYLLQRRSNGVAMLPVVFMNIFAGIAGNLAFMATRRARMLWLRAGLDRAGLFALSERTALQAFAQMLLSATIVLGIFSIAVKPEQASKILVFGASQLAYSTVLFYFGLSQTRGWTAEAIGGYAFLGLGLIVQMIVLLPQTTGIPPVVAPVLIGISLSLALLLRQHARKRWLSLDWHLNRPAVLQRQ